MTIESGTKKTENTEKEKRDKREKNMRIKYSFECTEGK